MPAVATAIRRASTAPSRRQPPGSVHAARPAQPHVGRRAPDRRARALLPPAQERYEHAHAGQPAAAHQRGHAGPGAVRRARAGAGHDVLAHRQRRRPAAADHVVQLREHRRQHRHHAAHPPQRRRVAGAEGGGEQHLRHGLRRAAHIRQSRSINTVHPAEGRRDEHHGGTHPGR